MNQTSSRSHSVLTIYIERQLETKDAEKGRVVHASKLNLVDLAGNPQKRV